MDRVTASEMKYAEAKKYATQTTADLLITQDNYDKAVEADKEQNENNGSESQNGNTSEDNSQNISYGKARNFTFEQNMQVRIGRRTLVHRAKLEKWINAQVK